MKFCFVAGDFSAMEVAQDIGMKKEEAIPSLIRSIDANEIAGFDFALMVCLFFI